MHAEPANREASRLPGQWWVSPGEGGRTSSTSNAGKVRFYKIFSLIHSVSVGAWITYHINSVELSEQYKVRLAACCVYLRWRILRLFTALFVG